MTYTVHFVDDVPPTFAVADRFCPSNQIWVAGGAMMIPVALAVRLPKPDKVRTVPGGGRFATWNLQPARE